MNLKYKTFLILFLIHQCIISFAQKPEKVYGIAEINKPYEWYISQSKLWEIELKKDKKNPEAWLNFYRANRAAKQKAPNNEWQYNSDKILNELDLIVKDAEKSIPNTFDLYYIKSLNTLRNEDPFPYVLKAYQIDPERYEVYSFLAVHYTQEGNKSKLEEVCKKWHASQEYDAALLAWNYNLLKTVDDNAVLFTSGDNNTFPLWILQNALSIKKNVQVLNIPLLTSNSDYINKVFKELQLSPYNKTQKDFKGQLEYYQELTTYITSNLKDKPIYFAAGTDDKLFKNYESNIYLVGLAFKYSKTPIDNLAYLKRNFEGEYLMDHVRVRFENEKSYSMMNEMNFAYIAPLIKLYHHYKISEDNQRTAEIKIDLLKIARESGNEQIVASVLNALY